MSNIDPIDASARIGHVHLKVSDLERSIAFYRNTLGFEVMMQVGSEAAFLSAGGYHHHIGLNTWDSEGGAHPERGMTGLYHLAIVYPNRASFAKATRRILENNVTLDGASDHGVSEAIYFRDPDQNGIEIYWDRALEDWPRTEDGKLSMFTRRLDVDALIAS